MKIDEGAIGCIQQLDFIVSRFLLEGVGTEAVGMPLLYQYFIGLSEFFD